MRTVDVRRYRTGWGVWLNNRRLDISQRTKAQAEAIANNLRGEEQCEHKFEKVGTGFYVCRKCGGKKFERDSPWRPR